MGAYIENGESISIYYLEEETVLKRYFFVRNLSRKCGDQMAFSNSLNVLNSSLFIFQREKISDIYFPHQRVLTPLLSIYFSTAKILRKQCTIFIVVIANGFCDPVLFLFATGGWI